MHPIPLLANALSLAREKSVWRVLYWRNQVYMLFIQMPPIHPNRKNYQTASPWLLSASKIDCIGFWMNDNIDKQFYIGRTSKTFAEENKKLFLKIKPSNLLSKILTTSFHWYYFTMCLRRGETLELQRGKTPMYSGCQINPKPTQVQDRSLESLQIASDGDMASQSAGQPFPLCVLWHIGVDEIFKAYIKPLHWMHAFSCAFPSFMQPC